MSQPLARKPSILWLIKGLGPGGAETLLVSMAPALLAQGFEISCAFTETTKDQLVSTLRGHGVRVLRLGRRWPLGWVAALVSLLRTEHFDVIHLHSPSVAAVARVLVKAMRVDSKIVYTEHNHWHAYNPVTRAANRATFRADDARIAVSSSVRDSLPKKHLKGTDTVVHGLPMAEMSPSKGARTKVREELGLRDGDVAILTVANLRRQKSYPDLVAAADAVCARHPHVRFFAAGQGPLESAIQRDIDRRGLTNRFALLGHRADVPDLMAACDIFVLASVWEGYPIALMEALVCGVPCVATRVGGAADAITDGVDGLLLEPRDLPALVAHIVRLVENPSLRQKIGVAAAAGGDRFDISRASDYLSVLYRRLTS